MGVNIDGAVTLETGQPFATLAQLREFVESTKSWGSETKVHVEISGGGLEIRSKLGDITGNY